MDHQLHEQIEFRAYQMWEKRGQPLGEPETDWFNAEKELTAADPEGALSRVAREAGKALGTVVAFLTDAGPRRPEPS